MAIWCKEVVRHGIIRLASGLEERLDPGQIVRVLFGPIQIKIAKDHDEAPFSALPHCQIDGKMGLVEDRIAAILWQSNLPLMQFKVKAEGCPYFWHGAF